MLFGRYALDPLFYLDTSRYQNCVVRVTYAMPISATVGFATGTTTISVIARLIDANANPYLGFVMTKEIASITTAASGDDATILPLDWPYAGLMVQALLTQIAPEAILTRARLLQNAGQYIPFDMLSAEILGENQSHFGYAYESFKPLVGTTFTWLSDLYSQTGAWFNIPGATGKGIVTTVVAEQVIGAMTTGDSANVMQIAVQGLAPHGCFWMPLSDGVDPTGFYPVQGVQDLRLIKTQGTVSALMTVVSAQVRQ